MTIKRGFLRAGVCGAVLLHAASFTVISDQALAACGTGGQCSVSGGRTANFSGGTYWATDWSLNGRRLTLPDDSALKSTGQGSLINASNIVVQPMRFSFFGSTWAQGHYNEKAVARDGGEIILTNATLTGGLRGLLAEGVDSQITMNGGSINVEQNAARVLGTSRLIFNGGVAIAVTGRSAEGVVAHDNARVIFNNASVRATGDWARAVHGNNRSHLSFTATDIHVSGADASGVEAHDDTNLVFTNGTIEASGEHSTAVSGRGNSTLEFDQAHIKNAEIGSAGLHMTDNAKLVFTNGTIESALGRSSRSAVVAMGNAELIFDNTDIKAYSAFNLGIATYENANVAFTNGTIEATDIQGWAILARNDSELALSQAQLTASGYMSNGIGMMHNAKVSFYDGLIEASGYDSRAVRGEDNSNVSLEAAQIIASGDMSKGIYLRNSAEAGFTNGSIIASGLDSQGVSSHEQARLDLGNVAVNATGDNSRALFFDGAAGAPLTPGSIVTMLGGTVMANSQATAIRAQGESFAHQFNVRDVVIEGQNRLIEAADTAQLNFTAENSVLSGSAKTIGNDANLLMSLQGSSWSLHHDATGDGDSSISQLDLANSVVRFGAPLGGVLGTYQSLTIGAGSPTTADIYHIDAGSHVEINTLINNGGDWNNQYTDRLFIRGNVAGRTLLKINEMIGSSGASSSAYGTNAADEGISLVQVSGDARPDSFYIEGDYMTLAGKPYVHRIYAFGPNSVHGAADSGQSRFGSAGHWDYRLQNEFIRNSQGWAVQVVPQVASYLSAPTALFQAGYMDVGNLHHRLGEMRQTQALEEGEQPAKMRGNFFLRAYGGDFDYHSDRSSIQYGYDADIRYGAVQAGGSLYGFDTAGGQMMFGLAGSYGDLAFSPDRLDSRKTSMDVWSASAYASWLGTNGFYLDTILSYGGFSGTVSTHRYDRTARLKGDSITASVEIGQNFALGSDGWSIEPQAQLIYQKLSFDRAHDADDFAIILGDPDQWVGRIGGKLSKTLTVEAVERLEIYGKLNLTHGFGDGDSVFLGDNFHIGEFGTRIEGGLGFNLDMSQNASLYGDVSYQGRIGDGGANGLALNGGLRFQF